MFPHIEHFLLVLNQNELINNNNPSPASTESNYSNNASPYDNNIINNDNNNNNEEIDPPTPIIISDQDNIPPSTISTSFLNDSNALFIPHEVFKEISNLDLLTDDLVCR